MSDFSSLYGAENEKIHSLMRKFHWDIVDGAAERIRGVLIVLHSVEVKNADVRPEIRKLIVEFERLRDIVDDVLSEASSLDSSIKRTHGCSGECNT